MPALPEFHNRDYWFLPEVSAKLALIKQAIAELAAPEEHKRFFYIAFSSLILARTSVANARDIVHSRHHYLAHQTPPEKNGPLIGSHIKREGDLFQAIGSINWSAFARVRIE